MNVEKSFPEFSFAFQPIANVRTGQVKSYEALVRGKNGGSAAEIFDKISEEDKYRFDEILRVSAIALAGKLGIKCELNLNFFPRSLSFSPTAISSTVDAAQKAGIPLSAINIEITEKEIIENVEWFRDNIVKYRHKGVKFSIDDFGAGYSGLNLLADFQPESIKIDITLVRDIVTNGPRQAIVRGIITTCQDLGIDVIAEGVESNAECKWFLGEGIELIQGYFLAKPGFEALPIPQMPKYFSA
jgi:EAL domain-containing protein (putative c-di-GMP-specific phosphodiesterase class I)